MSTYSAARNPLYLGVDAVADDGVEVLIEPGLNHGTQQFSRQVLKRRSSGGHGEGGRRERKQSLARKSAVPVTQQHVDTESRRHYRVELAVVIDVGGLHFSFATVASRILNGSLKRVAECAGAR